MSSRFLSRAAWTASLAVLLLSTPSWAAELREIRVGNHPTFTRVVFELDAPAGYRFERRSPKEGPDEIVVTLAAGSKSRSITSRSVMVERIGVEAARDEAVARIRLRKSPSRVKELILGNPPRIVLDIVFPAAQLQAQREAAARRARRKPVEEPRRAEPPVPEPVARVPVPEREIHLEPPKPRPEPVAEAPQPAPVIEPSPPEPVAEPRPPEPVVEAPSPVEPEAVADEPVAELPERVAGVEEPPAPVAEVEEGAPLEPEAAPERIARAPVPTPPSGTLPERKPADTGGLARIDWVIWGGATAGLLAVLLAVVLVVRRRTSPSDLEVRALAEGEGGAIPGEGFAMGEDATVSIARPTPHEQPGAPEPGRFDQEPEKEIETMDTRSTDLPTEHAASDMPTQVGAAGAEADVMRLVRDLERRVTQLETRLDESLEARERLERQVAAQSEELRVQRTAIARTQRALRSLNRGEEEQATEPALRQPSK